MKSVSTITVQVIISVIVFIANTVMPFTVAASGDLVASCRSKAKMLCIEHHHHHRQSPDKELQDCIKQSCEPPDAQPSHNPMRFW